MSQQTKNDYTPTKEAQRPQDELHLYDQVVRPQSDDDFLERNNLGLGHYDTDQYWQQVDSFRDGLYARAAFTDTLRRRAIKETVVALGKEEYEELPETTAGAIVACPNRDCGETYRYGDLNGRHVCRECETRIAGEDWKPETKESVDRRRYIIREGRRRWNAIDQEADTQEAAARERERLLEQYAGTSEQWQPPQMRMLMMRHEASRSVGARLLDNLFERVKEMRNDTDSSGKSLMPGRSSGRER